MGYDLSPRNKDLEGFYFGAFSWTWMLEAGVGLIIGTGKGIEPASYSYIPDKLGRDPNNNNGFRVTAEQSKAMALAAQGLAVTKGYINKQWEAMSKEKRERMEETNRETRDLYTPPIREDFIEKVNAFAIWAYKSHGFSIH